MSLFIRLFVRILQMSVYPKQRCVDKRMSEAAAKDVLESKREYDKAKNYPLAPTAYNAQRPDRSKYFHFGSKVPRLLRRRVEL